MSSPAPWPIDSRLDIPLAQSTRSAAPQDGDSWRHTAQLLGLLRQSLTPSPRLLRPGDLVYRAGEHFTNLYILNSGVYKIVDLAADGREHVAGLRFRGDWLGFDSIASGRYICDVIALETGEVWALRYDALLRSCTTDPRVLTTVHDAMSREIARDRESLMSVCTLPAHARVAEFLYHWSLSLATLGMRTDHIVLRMTRAEIGNNLGMTLETVSRAMSKLANAQVIAFTDKSRREITIPDLTALAEFVAKLCSAAANEMAA